MKREHRLTNATQVSDSVPEMLCEGSNLSEVLWNFSRFKDQNRIALRQNAQFYKGLDAKQIYGGDFQRDPIEKFLDTPEHKIFVLTDRQCRVHLEPEGRPRAFGNVWCPKRSLIFKGASESSLALSIFAHFNIRRHLRSASG